MNAKSVLLEATKSHGCDPHLSPASGHANKRPGGWRGFRLATRPDAPAAYRAHPLLDPFFPSRQRAAARFWVASYRSLVSDPEKYSQVVRSLATALQASEPALETPGPYFQDVDKYIDDLLRTAPEALKYRLELLPQTRITNELRALLRTAIEGPDSRTRYEAQRKLYLAKLLFDIDHCRSVRDGPRHRAAFETLLERTLWSETESEEEVEVCCELDSEGFDQSPLRIVAPSPRSQCWCFHVRHLLSRTGEPTIDVYYYRSRFKREVTPVLEPRPCDGLMTLKEAPRWPILGGRSGSILSKMIRRGIGDPQMIQDLLGAMFIVGSRRQVYALERRLVHALGGPLHWRDRVDTISTKAAGQRLNAQSSPGFQVLKQIVDILVEDPSGAPRYLCPVEIQIYPLEAYLRTLHDSHFANHTAYKRRQFLKDLLPLLFPPEIYGAHGELWA